MNTGKNMVQTAQKKQYEHMYVYIIYISVNLH